MNTQISYIRFTVKLWFKETLEKLNVGVAWLLPKEVVKWAAVRLMAHATQGEYSTQIVPELTAMDALKRWETV